MPAKIEKSNFGITIVFPHKSYIDSMTYVSLMRNGFKKVHVLGWNHYRAQNTEYNLTQAESIVHTWNQKQYKDAA